VLYCRPRWEHLPLRLLGKCHHGSWRQYPCHPRFRFSTCYKDAMLHLFCSQCLLYYCMHDSTTISSPNAISWLCGLVILFLLFGSDISAWIDVLPAREDGQLCDHCKYTKSLVSVEVRKLSISIICVTHSNSLAFSILGFLNGVFTAEDGLPLTARIGCGLGIIVGTGLTIPIAIAALGPGLIRQWEIESFLVIA
jgi:hypothetical protein